MIDDSPTLERACMLLAVLVEEIRALRVDVARAGRKPSSSTPRVLSGDDVAGLTGLLPAIVAAIGAETFTVRRLREAAQARTRAAKTLHAALAAAALDPLRLGRLLSRATESETPIAGLYVHRIAPSRDGVMFCVDEKTREHHIASSISTALRENLST